jgi:hypothetical protein
MSPGNLGEGKMKGLCCGSKVAKYVQACAARGRRVTTRMARRKEGSLAENMKNSPRGEAKWRGEEGVSVDKAVDDTTRWIIDKKGPGWPGPLPLGRCSG